MQPNRASGYLGLTVGLSLLLAGALIHGERAALQAQPELAAMSLQVQQLELTDLCLFSEASYTRHLSQADRFTAFQDSPMALEHFPSGALAGPPEQVRRP
jgi:hypothetical protein